mgnify:FL=1
MTCKLEHAERTDRQEQLRRGRNADYQPGRSLLTKMERISQTHSFSLNLVAFSLQGSHLGSRRDTTDCDTYLPVTSTFMAFSAGASKSASIRIEGSSRAWSNHRFTPDFPAAHRPTGLRYRFSGANTMLLDSTEASWV